MDCHKVYTDRRVVTLYNAPYSCEFSPIEYYFSTLKRNISKRTLNFPETIIIKAINDLDKKRYKGFFRIAIKKMIEFAQDLKLVIYMKWLKVRGDCMFK